MAPLLLSDNVNIASAAGTWIGTVFAGVGLLAIFSQLRGLSMNLLRSRRYLLDRSAGNWAILVPTKNMPQRGLVEGVAPCFQGWLQSSYREDAAISMTWDYRKGGGTSGWSNLFSHAGINPLDLMDYGGPNARVFPAVTGNLGPGEPPRLSDMIFEEGKVSYGFTRNEFTALLILCGFRISDFSISGLTTSTGFLGTLALVESGPFSQVGRFDPHDGCRNISEDLERYVNILPVQRCIDYSLGILKTPKRGGRRLIIPAATSVEDEGSNLSTWTTWPAATQLDQIRFNLEQFLSISGAEVLEYSIETAADLEYERETMETVSPGFSLGREKMHQIVLIAHALAALNPWGLLPVMPTHFARAFTPLLAPFVGSRSETVTVLQQRMCDMRLQPLAGWDSIEQQAMALSQMGDIKTNFFSGSNSTCRQYFKAMNMVFDAYGFPMADVRNKLAANVASKLFQGDALPDDFSEKMTFHLGHGLFPAKIPDWAISVYVAYLWGWLNDHIPMDFDFRSKFNRRIFLE